MQHDVLFFLLNLQLLDSEDTVYYALFLKRKSCCQSFLFPVQMAASADSRYQVSCAQMCSFEALVKLLGSRSERVGGWLVGEVHANVCVHICVLICLYMTLFVFSKLGNKPTLIYHTVIVLGLLDT